MTLAMAPLEPRVTRAPTKTLMPRKYSLFEPGKYGKISMAVMMMSTCGRSCRSAAPSWCGSRG